MQMTLLYLPYKCQQGKSVILSQRNTGADHGSVFTKSHHTTKITQNQQCECSNILFSSFDLFEFFTLNPHTHTHTDRLDLLTFTYVWPNVLITKIIIQYTFVTVDKNLLHCAAVAAAATDCAHKRKKTNTQIYHRAHIVSVYSPASTQNTV